MEVKEETPEEAAQMADSGGEIVEPPVPAPAAAPAAAPATQEEMPGGSDERHRRSGLGQAIFFLHDIRDLQCCLVFNVLWMGPWPDGDFRKRQRDGES